MITGRMVEREWGPMMGPWGSGGMGRGFWRFGADLAPRLSSELEGVLSIR